MQEMIHKPNIQPIVITRFVDVKTVERLYTAKLFDGMGALKVAAELHYTKQLVMQLVPR